MALNREQKRQLRRQGEINEEGDPVATRRRGQKAPPPKSERVGARQFLREVRAELRKVAWPTRSETINYSIIVFVALIVVTAFIFAIDWVFSTSVLRLFDV
ncbi:MAG: preprotein translocase subunit SecE [Acidimicrobiia bacterium]|nr:preprotein translocase subunit SecE [Acidimicrobiia bacterium]